MISLSISAPSADEFNSEVNIFIQSWVTGLAKQQEPAKKKTYIEPSKFVASDPVTAGPVEEIPTEKHKPVMTLEDIRAIIVPLSQNGHKDAIKAKIKELGAESLPKLDASKFEELIAYVKTL